MGSVVENEDVRTARLIDAQDKAVALFDRVVADNIITAGVTERAASDAIRDLAADLYGVERFWHKRIVRAGPNTLEPYQENPPDRLIEADDIVFFDFGPIFAEWEADFGRTLVLGDDPAKHALRDALHAVWHGARDHYLAHPDLTGEQFYAYVVELTERAGWEFGGTIAGHLIGQFPHEKIAGDDVESYIAPGNATIMRRHDRNGQVCHWILEVHIVDRSRNIGGFVEELLDIGTAPMPPAVR